MGEKEGEYIFQIVKDSDGIYCYIKQGEIIRCKDCRFQDKGRNESESWNLCGYRPWLHVPTEDEHYCGYAERRIDE